MFVGCLRVSEEVVTFDLFRRLRQQFRYVDLRIAIYGERAKILFWPGVRIETLPFVRGDCSVGSEARLLKRELSEIHLLGEFR